MKCVYVALVCLSVAGGLINCTPFSPLDIIPEKVLPKQKEQGGMPNLSEIPQIPIKVVEAIVEAIKEAISGKDKPKLPIGEDVRLSEPLSVAAEHIDDFTTEEKAEEQVKQLEPKPEGAEAESRKRRSAIIPATKIVNPGKPHVEDRYQPALSGHSVHSGHFLKDQGDFIVSDPQALEGSNRPVIIYINKMCKLHLQSSNSDGEDCEDCGN